MRCTIKDVAKLAATSTATVSLVLNNRPGVNENTRKRVMEAVKKLNYRPNQTARNLIRQRTNTIGLIVSDILNPYYGELAYNMQKEMNRRNINLTLGISNNKVANEKQIIESMIQRGVDGILLVPARNGEKDLQHLYELRELGIPFVFITNRYKGIEADTVMTDLEQASYELTSYLIKTGEKKIVMVVENQSLFHVEQRIAGYYRALKEYGLHWSEDSIIEVEANIENGVSVTQNVLLKKKPDAVIAINAFTAMGIMKVLRENHIAIPEDMAVSCFDDLEYASILYTPLTVVRQPLDQICREAVDLLGKRIHGEESEKKLELIPGELIIRNSTKILK